MQWIVFDCETTGLSPLSGDRICEIGAVKIEKKKIVDRYWSLIDPEREISYSAYMVNRITPEMLKDAPKMEEVLPSFLEFVGKSKLAAYNAKFDLSFLNAELVRAGYPSIPGSEIIDIYILAKKVLPKLGFYPLWNVARKLNLTVTTAHRALADAEVAANIFIRLLEIGGHKILNLVHLDYLKLVSKLEKAILDRQEVKVKYRGPEGKSYERTILPQKIRKLLGQEFLEYRIEDSLLSLPLEVIEEVW